MRTFFLILTVIFFSCNKEKEEVKPPPFKLKGTWESVNYRPSTITFHDVWEFKNDSEYTWTMYDSISEVLKRTGKYKVLSSSRIRINSQSFAYYDFSYQIIDNRTLLYCFSNNQWIVAYKK